MRKANIPDVRVAQEVRFWCEDIDGWKEQGFQQVKFFPRDYCLKCDEKTIHYNGKCVRRLYEKR